MNKNQSKKINLEEFKQHLVTHGWYKKDRQFFAAVSGGMDSMVLVHLLYHIGLRPVVVHCNFQLRGGDSDADEALVKSTCTAFGLKLLVKRFDTASIKMSKTESTQMIARNLRYEWFKLLLKQTSTSKVMFAHHLDDQIETLFINLSRGTGFEGLYMKAETTIAVRPLLNMTRQQLYQYAVENNIRWREDSSNASDAYKRNYFRHHGVPVLESLNPAYQQVFLRNFDRFAQGVLFLGQQTEKIFEAHIKTLKFKTWFIPFKFEGQQWSPFLLHAFLKKFGFYYHDCMEIASHQGQVGTVFSSSTHKIWKDRQGWFLEEIKTKSFVTHQLEYLPSKDKEVYITWDYGKIILRMMDEQPQKLIGDKSNIVYLDVSKIHGALTLRNLKEGDQFQPLGMHGKKKVSRFLTDQKIPLIFKNRQMVLCDEEKILWLVNRRIDHRVRLSLKTKRILEIIFID